MADTLTETSSSYHFLNGACAGHLAYIYEENAFATQVALGSGWPMTVDCHPSASTQVAVKIGVR